MRAKRTEYERFANRKDFRLINTRTDRKRETEALLDSVFEIPLKQRLANNPEATFHILVGSTKCLDEHLARMKDLGAKLCNVFIHERNAKLANALTKACEKRGYPCQVIEGDMIMSLEMFLEGGMEIAYVEFDGTDSYGTFEFDLFKIVKEYLVPCLLVQGATRDQSGNFREWCPKNGIRKTYNKYQHTMRYELKRIAPIVAKREMPEYESTYDSYKGRTGMYAQTFVLKAA